MRHRARPADRAEVRPGHLARCVLHAFRAGRIDVVVSTDLAAEGLNLQRAGMVVHYDLPWNPVKLGPRNGRAHRIGQTRRLHQRYEFRE